jgi:hypothetical protein
MQRPLTRLVVLAAVMATAGLASCRGDAPTESSLEHSLFSSRDSSSGDTIPGDSVPNDTTPPDTIPPDTIPPDTIPPDTIPPDTIPPDTIPAGHHHSAGLRPGVRPHRHRRRRRLERRHHADRPAARRARHALPVRLPAGQHQRS